MDKKELISSLSTCIEYYNREGYKWAKYSVCFAMMLHKDTSKEKRGYRRQRHMS